MCSSNIKHPRTLAFVSIIAFYILVNFGWYILAVATIYHLFKKKKGFTTFLGNLGLASDDVGGTIFFWTIRHSISANVGLRAYKKMPIFIKLAVFIDFLFGDNHCYCVAKNEGMINVDSI